MYNHYTPTYNQEIQPAMGGLFSWLRRAVNNTIRFLAPVIPFSAVFDDFTNGDGRFNFGLQMPAPDTNIKVDFPLTINEENALDRWISNTFLPFYKPYLSQIKLYIASPPTLKVFTNYYNNTKEFIGLLKWYETNVMKTGEGSFSTNALMARNEFIRSQIELLESQLQTYIKSVGINITPTKVSKTIEATKYANLNFVTPSSFKVTMLQILQNNNQNNDDVLVSDGDNPINNQAQQIIKESKKWPLWLKGLAVYGVFKLIKG